MTSDLQIEDVTQHFAQARETEALYRVTAPSVALDAFIAIDHSGSGPTAGGIRRWAYRNASEAVSDVTSLARQMTLKTRFAALPCGGAKAVIIDRPGLDLQAVYRAFGRAVETLQGRYLCGPDIGTGEDEMAAVREMTAFANAPSNDASEATAAGVLAGIQAAIQYRFGPSARDLEVFVQGLGRVGSRVAHGLAPKAKRVWLEELNPACLASVTQSLTSSHPQTQFMHTASDGYVGRPLDLFAPCARGPVIRYDVMDSLDVKLVCGCANTQLEDDAIADLLHEKGILYIPDFVVNAGAVIEGVLITLNPTGPTPALREQVKEAIEAIEHRVHDLLKQAAETRQSPLSVAKQIALEG